MRHHEPERGGWERPALGTVLLWASLVPVLALARPYGGLIKDARIYIGRGLADRDPAGLGRDLLFANDPQTGFSALAQVVRGLLTVMPAGQASLLLVSVGLLLWLCAAVAVARGLTSVTSSRTANDRLVWATVVAILALPSAYGAFDIFGYAEANATPRIFAEAAVLASFAAALAGRRSASLAFLVLAGAIHPLMALPGLAVGACLLVLDDRRWLALLAGLGAAVLAAAFFEAAASGPVVHRHGPDLDRHHAEQPVLPVPDGSGPRTPTAASPSRLRRRSSRDASLRPAPARCSGASWRWRWAACSHPSSSGT